VRRSTDHFVKFVAARTAASHAGFSVDEFEQFARALAATRTSVADLSVRNSKSPDRQQWYFVVDGIEPTLPLTRKAAAAAAAAVTATAAPTARPSSTASPSAPTPLPVPLPSVAVSKPSLTTLAAATTAAHPGTTTATHVDPKQKGVRTLSAAEPFVLVDAAPECLAAMNWLLVQRAVGIKAVGSTDASGLYTARALLVSTPVPADESREGVYVFDFAVRDDSMRKKVAEVISKLFASSSTIKVVHDARLDVDAVRRVMQAWTASGRFELARIFDTQVMARTLAEMSAVELAVTDRASLDQALRAVSMPATPEATLRNSPIATFWSAQSTVLMRDGVVDVVARHVAPLLTLHAKLLQQYNASVGQLSATNVRWLGGQAIISRSSPTAIGEVALMTFDRDQVTQQLQLVCKPLSECAVRPLQCGLAPISEMSRAADETELERFMGYLPPAVCEAILLLVGNDLCQLTDNLVQIRMDLNRPVSLRWRNGATQVLERCVVDRAAFDSMREQWARGQATLGSDGRLAVDFSLHRLCVLTDNRARITAAVAHIRVQRSGSLALIFDVVGRLVAHRKSLLVFGAADNGRTALLRELASALAERMLVVVVDTNGDLGGDGVTKHWSIGNAVRAVVSPVARATPGDAQAQVMIESVLQLRANAIVVDEISTLQQVDTARRLIGMGVIVLAGSRSPTLLDAVKRAELHSLIGHSSEHNSVLTTKGAPPFAPVPAISSILSLLQHRGHGICEMAIEVSAPGDLLVHDDVSRSLGAMVGHSSADALIAVTSHRWSDVSGNLWCRFLQGRGSHSGHRERWLQEI
jgi:stage III sporulation protein SpoIIIAA